MNQVVRKACQRDSESTFQFFCVHFDLFRLIKQLIAALKLEDPALVGALEKQMELFGESWKPQP